jgi:hypothetical protein
MMHDLNPVLEGPVRAAGGLWRRMGSLLPAVLVSVVMAAGLAPGAVQAQAQGTTANPGQRDVIEQRSVNQSAYGRELEGRAVGARGDMRRPVDIARERRMAQTAATAAGTGCDVTEAAVLGQTIEGGHKIFEVVCNAQPGYIIIASEPPQAHGCVAQAGYAVTARAADPNADVGLQCSLPGNLDTVQVIAGYGREAGVQCEVDQAVATAIDIYEIGCSGRDGWVIEKRDSAWLTTPCWQLSLKTDQTCLYSSREEAAAEWRVLVAGSSVAACVPADVFWMGDNAQRGSFYEIRCASGEGVIVRFKDGATQQTYSCNDAQQVFRRPCTLTTAAAPAAAPAGGRP